MLLTSAAVAKKSGPCGKREGSHNEQPLHFAMYRLAVQTCVVCDCEEGSQFVMYKLAVQKCVVCDSEESSQPAVAL